MCPLNAETIPTSGAWIQSVARRVVTESEPVTAGNAATATTPTSAETSTAAPRPTNRLRGIDLPGSRASCARLASVSRPV